MGNGISIYIVRVHNNKVVVMPCTCNNLLVTYHMEYALFPSPTASSSNILLLELFAVHSPFHSPVKLLSSAAVCLTVRNSVSVDNNGTGRRWGVRVDGWRIVRHFREGCDSGGDWGEACGMAAGWDAFVSTE